MPLPSMTVRRTDMPAPLEGQDVDTGTGLVSSMEAAMESTLGASLVVHALGKAYELDPRGQKWVPRDVAAQIMKAQNYDSNVLPEDGLSVGALHAIMSQQSVIARSRDLANRSRLGGFAQVTTGLVGGVADPLFLAAGPVIGRSVGAVASRAVPASVQAGRVASAAPATAAAAQKARAAASARPGLTAPGRAVAGVVEGGAAMVPYEVGVQQVGTAPGDRDLTTYDMARNVVVGSLLGGGLAVAFGRVTPRTAAALERSEAAAALHNRRHPDRPITVDQVISPAGAVGKHQVMPDMHMNPATGRFYTKQELLDPVVNERASAEILARLNKRYGHLDRGDEAVVIAYNAGPGRANKWLAANYDDSVLVAETLDYVTRYRQGRGLPGEQTIVRPGDEAITTGPRRSALTIRDEHIEAMQANDTVARRSARDIEAEQARGRDLPSIFAERPRPLPPEVMQDVSRVAIRDALEDVRTESRPVVEAALEQRTAMPPVAKFRRQAVDPDAPPRQTQARPRSIFDTNQTREQQAKVDSTPPAPKGTAETGPLAAAEQPHVDAAIKEAQDFASRTDDDSFARIMEEHDRLDAESNAEMSAIEAAFRCGLTGDL